MRILIFGAGSTGCYIGAQCLSAGLSVDFLCRESIKKELQANEGIEITDYSGNVSKAPLPRMHTTLLNHRYDLCLVTLKCHHLSNATLELEKLLEEGCELHFMQNGLYAYHNIPALKESRLCQSGITPFNVVSLGQGRFHKGTEGVLQLQQTIKSRQLHRQLHNAGLEIELLEDIKPIVFGKLLLNLNNAINAISNRTLKEQLENRNLRKVLAAAMREYLNVCSHLEQEIEITSPVPPHYLPNILELPTWLFRIVAKKMLTIDPQARSSMWEDIQEGKKTEIDFLNGKVVQLAKEARIPCPVNEQIVTLIKQLELGEPVTESSLSLM